MSDQAFIYQVTTITGGHGIPRDNVESLVDAYEVMRDWARAGHAVAITTISLRHTRPLLAVAKEGREWPGGPQDGADRYGVEAEL